MREEEEKRKQEETSLTPWQLEHQKFINEQGKKTFWQKEEEESSAEEIQPIQELSEEEFLPEEEEFHYESFQEKLPKLKKQRSQKLMKQLAVIFSIFLVALVVLLYFVSPLSKVESIRVSGNERLSSKKILQASTLLKGESLWTQLFHKRQIEQSIQEMSPRLQSAKVKLSGWNDLVIDIREYPEIAYQEDENVHHYQPVLTTGKVMKETLEKPAKELLVLKGFHQKATALAVEQYQQLSPSLQRLISGMRRTPTSTNPTLVVLFMRDGNEVKISLEEISERLEVYPKIAKKMPEAGVVDMELGVYSYPFSKKEEEEKRGKDSDQPKKPSENEENEEESEEV